MKRLLVILGSTSTGKTDLAIFLAKKFNGELVACDSRQVYEGLDVGTGKLPDKEVRIKKGMGFWEMDGIKVWMYDVADPKKQYTVYDYVKDAHKVIDEILKRGKLPIIVGGTGLYLKALLEGLSNLLIPPDQKLRQELDRLSLQQLQEKLQELSSEKWENMNNSDRQNSRRLIRYIELASILHTEETLRFDQNCNDKISNLNVLKIGLTAPREILYKRIDERVISRINQGMIEEAKKLQEAGLSFKRMRQLGLEYGVLADYLQGNILSEIELIKVLQGKIHRFARRQETWFKKEKNIFQFDIIGKNYITQLENMVRKWYDTGYATEN